MSYFHSRSVVKKSYLVFMKFVFGKWKTFLLTTFIIVRLVAYNRIFIHSEGGRRIWQVGSSVV
jgi:hypothetical protein